MRYRFNPLSQARREYLRPHIIKAMADQYRSVSPPKGLTLLEKVKIGPFKVSHWIDAKSGTHCFAGFRHLIHNLPKEIEDTLPIGSLRDDNIDDSFWLKYKEQCSKFLPILEERVETFLNNIAEADPTASGEYATWIARQALAGNIRISGHSEPGHPHDEDVEKLHQDLSAFEGRKRRGAIPVEYRDINRYATYGDFFEALGQFGGLISDREALQVALQQGKQVYKSTKYEVIEIKSWQLAKKLAAGTAWCVRGTEMAKHYLKEPEKFPLYLFLRYEERYALLTNLPNSEQFMNVKDEAITEQEIRGDAELLSLVSQFSSWIYCGDCDRFFWGHTDSTLRTAINDVLSDLRNEDPGTLLSEISSHLGNSWLIAKAPSGLANEPVVGRPELFQDKIIMGPSTQVLRIEDVELPPVSEFTEKSGLDAASCVRSIVEHSVCGTCNSVKLPLADVLHAFFVLKACEDFPCCGHEPLPMGAPGCPPTNTDGLQVGMRCICGAFVPSSSSSSLCRKCLETAIREDNPYDDYGYDEYDYDDYEDIDDYDGCPAEDLSTRLTSILRRWKLFESKPWNLGRDSQGQLHHGPHWDEFEDVYEILDRQSDHLDSKVRSLFKANRRNLRDIAGQGMFDQTDFVHLKKFYEDLSQLLSEATCQRCAV